MKNRAQIKRLCFAAIFLAALNALAAKGERANFEIGYHGGDVECVDSFRPRGEFRRPGADGWREGYAYVIVPKGADNFCIYLGVDSSETIRYDDVAVYADDLQERK